MGIISEIGRKNIKVRILIWSISLALMIGALTMIYPFALMFSGSSKSSVDKADTELIPFFLKNKEKMYQKSVESIFNEKSMSFQTSYSLINGDFKQLKMPSAKNINPILVEDWEQFIAEKDYKHYYYELSFIQTYISKNSSPLNLRDFKKLLSTRFDGNLEKMNNAMQLELVSWNVLFISAAEYLNSRMMPNTDTELYSTYYAFKEKFFDGSKKDDTLVNRYFFNPEGYFISGYLTNKYTKKIKQYNIEHKTKYKSWAEVKLTRFYPADKNKYTDLQRADWNEFVRTLLNRFWIKVLPKALPGYHSYLKGLYNNKIVVLNKLYNTKYKRFSEIKLLTQLKDFPFSGKRLADWSMYIVGWIDSDDNKFYQVPNKYLELTGAVYDFRTYLKNKYRTLATANNIFNDAHKALLNNFKDWNAKLSVNSKALSYYRAFLQAKYKNKIADLNKLYCSKYNNFAEIELLPQLQNVPSFRKRLYDWGSFLSGWTNLNDVNDNKNYQLPIKYLTTVADLKYKTVGEANNSIDNSRKELEKALADIQVTPDSLKSYHAYLKIKYNGNITELNNIYNSKYKKFNEIKLVTQLKKSPAYGARLVDWSLFLTGWIDTNHKVHKIKAENLKPATAAKEIIIVRKAIDEATEELNKTTKSIVDTNKAFYNSNKLFNFSNWSNIKGQQQASHYLWINKNSASLKWEFVKRNFISVFDYIVLHGYAIWNTFVYCASAVLCALIVNPLAAYALSRFNPPSTYKILLFLMVTMAFPPMVTQIPVFLLLRELSLLNTYGALILPALANGYMVFLLKGFFDSLPRELYESAQIDGASECRIFLQITMSLSKPILAVIALQTFQIAYSNFMMALLYCQDENMWTIMPWLYQLQSNSCTGVIFASLMIAALPTFLVFTLCQNIIMRGIVVPVEK